MRMPPRWFDPWKHVRVPEEDTWILRDGELWQATHVSKSVPRLRGRLGRLWIRLYYRINLWNIRREMRARPASGELKESNK